ncbi:MAG: hypothetical protein JRC89_11790 [Deltaproteobacteria bacterium]|nr:hypothetical protein [Deltaproteobacteria bacterium]MBW2644018.1 hypothetical protein [Deltaproteobacteria bacterium]
MVSGNAETYTAIWATVKVSGYSIGCSLLIGIPLGFCLGYFDFTGKKPIRTLVDTMMVLPTVFIGLLVYAFLTRRSLLGDFGMNQTNSLNLFQRFLVVYKLTVWFLSDILIAIVAD